MLNVLNKFETLELENTLTSLIQRLMEPHLHNFYKNQALLTDLSQQFRGQLKEVQTLKENLEPKYNELKLKLQSQEQKLQENFKVCITQSSEKQYQIDQIKNQIQTFSTESQQAEIFYREAKQELQEVKVANFSFKTSLEQSMDKINQIYNQEFSDLKQQIIGIDQSQRKIIHQISHEDAQIKAYSMKLDQIKNDISSNNLKNFQQAKTIDKVNQMLETLIEENKIIKNNLQVIDEFKHKLSSIEIYLRYYQHYHIQNQINDSLFFSLPLKFFSKYAQFEKQKFDEFDKTILNINNDYNIQELMDWHKTIVLKASKRFQKAQETLKNAENDQDSSVEDQQGDENKTTQFVDSKNQKKTKRKQSANLVYFEEQLRQLKEQFDQQLDEKSNEINSLKQKFKELNDELYLSQIQFQANIELNIQKQASNSKQSINNLQQLLNEIQSEFSKSDYKKLNEEIALLKQFKLNMLRISSNILCLLRQDELDKEDLKLLGGKDIQIDSALSIMNSQGLIGNKKKSIMLNSSCLSCSGSPIQLFQFFKVACLGYNPSEVEIDGRFFKRVELIQKCQEVIQELHHRKKSLIPVKERQIRNFEQRSNSIQASPRFFSTENRQKFQKLSQMKIYQ
ncbi:unnamed protein product [Paramecium sonneborni]|uniref:Uncharacterized protein n=1 Tax=Paramecium sonneborni TaxID=65129 RepID=A0A8S1QHJ7_9CILI|nr:unnamed protein product [Paramecium sonneborni]